MGYEELDIVWAYEACPEGEISEEEFTKIMEASNELHDE